MQITEIIRKKRDGESLNEAELIFFVDGFTGGKIPDYQASALLMAIFINRNLINSVIAFDFCDAYSASINWFSRFSCGIADLPSFAQGSSCAIR